MKTSPIAFALVSMTVAVAACNQPDKDRTVSIPGGVAAADTMQGPPGGYSTAPAQPERGPIPPNANAAAPGTDATAAFAKEPNVKDVPPQPEKGGAPEDQHRGVMAQDAAAKAPDTASADAAKQEVMSGNDANTGSKGPSTPGAGSSRSQDE